MEKYSETLGGKVLEAFIGDWKGCVAFTEKGIVYHAPSDWKGDHVFIPYGCAMEDFKMVPLGNTEIFNLRVKDLNLSILFRLRSGDVGRFRYAFHMAQKKLAYDGATPIQLEPVRGKDFGEKYINLSNVSKEHYMHCEVCGHVYCYTDSDKTSSTLAATAGALSAVGGLLSVFSGDRIGMLTATSQQRTVGSPTDYKNAPIVVLSMWKRSARRTWSN